MKPIKTALCSFGMSGGVFHAPFLQQHPGFEFYAVFERTKNLAETKYPAVKTFRSLEEMLEDEAIELLIVNTPNYTHSEYAKMGLEAGKHVVVEKPMTIRSSEAFELIEIASGFQFQTKVDCAPYVAQLWEEKPAKYIYPIPA